MKEYRITFTTAREQYEYTVDADTPEAAISITEDWATADGWNGLGTTTVREL